MRVLVDTSIWSLALRRHSPASHKLIENFRSLIADHRVEMIGPIRQELLSGIRTTAQIESLQEHLAAFPDIPVTTEDYEMAAKFFNLCRAKGIQGSNTDYLICSVSVRHHLAIFSSDKDFLLFSEHLPIVLFER